jgi:hypothetical protein
MPKEISAKVTDECTGAVDHSIARILRCVSSIDKDGLTDAFKEVALKI